MGIRATDFYSEEAYYAALDERVATEGEADREFARNVGQAHPDRAWILSDRDVWYANPAYRGPAVRHPEDDADDDYEDDRDRDQVLADMEAAVAAVDDLDLPF